MVAKFTQICRHTEYVDNLDMILEEYASLGDLWYFRECFKQNFVNAISGGLTQPMRSMVYLRLLAEFAVRPNVYVSLLWWVVMIFQHGFGKVREEHENRGKACVLLARNFLERIAVTINNGLVIMANHFAKFEEQLSDQNIAYTVLKDAPTWKPAKDFVAPETPGAEST
jgi:hypothetical protein